MSDTLRDELALLAPTVDVAAGHAQFRRRIEDQRRRRRRLTGTFVVATGAAVIAGLYALTLRDRPVEPVNPASPVPTSAQTATTSASTPDFQTIGTSDDNIDLGGSLAAAGNATQLAELWSHYRIEGSPPAVDFSVDVVIAFNGPDDAGCPGTFAGMERSEPNTFTPVFARPDAQADPTLCTRTVFGHTLVLTGRRSTLGDRFTIRMPATSVSVELALDVAVDADGVTTSAPLSTGTSDDAPPFSTTPTTAAETAQFEFKRSAEQAIESNTDEELTATCATPGSADVGTTFGCTATRPNGSTLDFIATITEPGRIDLVEAAPATPDTTVPTGPATTSTGA